MAYAWIIDTDKISNGQDNGRISASSAHGMAGTYVADLKKGAGTRFRMLDDDDEVYYEGRFVGDHDSEDGFIPLDDYGMPNAGCTSIQYLTNGIWETL